MSRSIAYYALFSVFPLLLVLITLAGFVLTVEEARTFILEWTAKYVPAAAELVGTGGGQGSLLGGLETQGTVGILGLIVLIWSASGVFTAIYQAVNRAWQTPPSNGSTSAANGSSAPAGRIPAPFWREKLYGLAVVLLVGFLLIASTLLSSVLSILQSWRPFAIPEAAWLWGWLPELLLPLISVATFIVLYRTIPSTRVTWRDVWLGGLITGLVYDAARRLFTWYLVNISSYSLLYGSVGAILGFLLWCYLSAEILLLGAEFTAQHLSWRRAGHPVETRQPSQWLKEWSR